MRTVFAALAAAALLCLYPNASAQGAAPLEGWEYSTDAYYISDQYADRGGMLCDGQTGRGTTVIYRGGSVVFTISLADAATVERVLADVHRHNMNYKLSELKVQALVGGHYQEIGQARGFWGPTETNDFEIAVDVTPTQTSELRLVFNTDGILSISELQLFGQAVAAQGNDGELPFTDVSQPTVREEDLDGDGTPEIILENSRVGLVFYPAYGGVAKTLWLKQAEVNLVTPGGPDQAMFRDQLWDPRHFFSQKHYHVETGDDEDSAWVELWTTGEGGILSFTEVRKRITLTRGSEVITADYTLSNDPSSQTDFVYGWWCHNFLGVKGQTNAYYFPTVDGVEELVYNPTQITDAIKGDHWYRELARGWTAVRAESGPGMAIQVPFRYLNAFYAWIGTGFPVATHEWRFNRLQIKSGEKLEAQIRILPFNDLPRVDGTLDDVVGAIEIDTPAAQQAKAAATINLASAAEPVTAEVGWRKSDEDEADFAIGEPTQVRPGETARIEVMTPELPVGSYVIVCRISRDGEALGDFERPFSIGGARIVYHREPLMEREGLTEKEQLAGLPRHDLSREVVTPHIKWATPLPEGPIRALTLTGDRNSREIIELAQRMEMDFTYVKFRTILDDQWLYQGDRSIPTLEHAQRRLMEELEDDYDLFLISGLRWDHHFTDEIRERIMEQVRGGAGLVYIEPDGFSADEPLGGAMGVAEDRNMWGFFPWQPVQAHYLTDGLPWDLFPVTRRMTYAQWPQGTVVATSGEGDQEQPLMVASNLGEGRTLAATWDVLTHVLSYRGYAGLTPILSYRGKWLRDEFAEMTWDYYEHWYALLARACTWAAKRESAVQIASVEAPDVTLGQDAAVQIRSKGPADGGFTAEITFRDRWSNELDTQRVDWAPDLSVPVPAKLRSGLTLVDVIVRDAAGASVGWGAGSFTVAAPAAITAVEVEERTLLGDWTPGQESVQRGRGWAAAEPFRCRVALDVIQPLTDDYRVRARLYDTHDRLLGEEIQPIQADAAEARFTVRPGQLRNMGVEWRVDLLRGDEVLDTDGARAICVKPREYDSLHFQSWGGMYLWRSHYLWELVHERVEDLGLDASRYGTVELENGLVWDEYWHNRMNWYGGLLGRPGDLPEFRLHNFGQIKAEWDRTGDKALLAREPCLNDPAWRDAMYAHLIEKAESVQEFDGSHSYDTGDEMSLTYYRSYFDFCWSEHCLGKFREWLQAKYGDLGALNAMWGTMHASWDDVVPLTLEEAREADNPAPWADHRDFMDTTMAEFMDFVRTTVREVDPEAHVGMSGTQAPSAGNGMDWWKMSKVFDHYISYNTAWSNEMRRSFQDDTIVRQAPYNAGYWQSGRALENRMWWCLLSDTVGIGAWTTHLFFYGDLTFSEAGRDTRDNLREMREGIWAQVRQGERDNDGIALHYSQATIRAGELVDRMEEVEAVRDAWVKLLEDLGLQYEFVASEQIEQGHLQEDGYRLLILPDSLAISDDEEAQIRAFAESGGTVLADMGCGLMDAQCRTNVIPALDDLFGIRHLEPTGQPPAQGLALTGAIGAVAAGADVKVTVPEDNLQLDGGTAFGAGTGEAQAPALIVTDAGRGRAIYLNMDLSQFAAERKFRSPTEAAIRGIVLGLLADVGVAPAYSLTYESGITPHVEITRHHVGEVTLLGLLREYDESAEDEVATVRLPEAAFVYNMRQHKPLGRTNEFTVPLAPGQAALFCISPRDLGAPSLSLAATEADAGDTLAYEVAGRAGDVSEAVHVTLLRPDGSEAEDYAQNLIVDDGSAAGTIPLALNDATGTWRIIARSALSGKTAEGSFEVR